MPAKDRKIAIMGFRSVGKSSLTIQFVENQFVDSYDPTIENMGLQPVISQLVIKGRGYLDIMSSTGCFWDVKPCYAKCMKGTVWHTMSQIHKGVNFSFEKTIKIGGQDYVLKIIDTAGQDEYSIFPQSLSVNIHGYVLVYAVTSQKSFDVIKEIHEKLLDMTGKMSVPLVLVGNKTDLHMERIISSQQGKQLADSWSAAFVESSAKQNESVTDIFKTVIQLIERLDGPQKKDENCTLL